MAEEGIDNRIGEGDGIEHNRERHRQYREEMVQIVVQLDEAVGFGETSEREHVPDMISL